jgi:predicted PurR-regulated permease PerM
VTPTPRLLLFGLFLFFLYLVYVVLRPLLGGILWAVVLVTAFHPIYVRLVRWLRGREWLASILLSTAVAAAIVLPISLAAVRVVRAVGSGYGYLRDHTDDGTVDPLAPLLEFLERVRAFAGRYVDVSGFTPREVVVEGVQRLGEALSAKSGAILGNTVAGALTFFVMLVTMAFLFKDSSQLLSEVRRSLPLSEEDRDKLFLECRSVVSAVFYGVIVTAGVQGLLAGIGCAIAGLKAAALTLAAATFFCGLLPVGGASLVWFPAGVYLIFTHKVVGGIFLLAWGAGVVSLVDNFLRPFFIGTRTRMHLLLISFGTFGGLAAFGLVGLFIGPVVIALFLMLLDVMRREIILHEPPEAPRATERVGS